MMTIPQSRRQFLMFSGTALAISLLKGCATPSPTASPTASDAAPTIAGATPMKAAMVLPGMITDKAWNQAGYEGLKLIESQRGAEIAYVEQVSQSDQAEALADFARRGYTLVYAHGGQFDAAIADIAPQFPQTFFVGVNGAVQGTNMASLRINHLQASYLCGLIAGAMTQSKRIAYLTAQSFQATDEELRGLELGAKAVNPAIQVSASYTGDWNDAAKAKEATLALIAAGADVIFQWLDNAAPAVLQTAQEQKIYAFGNTADQFNLAPEAVLTSSVKRIDLAIAYTAELLAQQQLAGQIYTLGLEQPEILHLGQFNPKIPEAVKAQVTQAQADILAQKLQFLPCQADGQSTYCVQTATS